jgi:hypothetical protein
MQVDTRQYLAAHEMLWAFAVRGKDLQANPAEFASHLGPIFCTSPDEQRLFHAEFALWVGEASSKGAKHRDDLRGRQRRSWIGRGITAAVGLAVVLIPLLVWLYKPPVPPRPPSPADGGVPGPGPIPTSNDFNLTPYIRIGPPQVMARGEFATTREKAVSDPWLFAIGGGVGCAVAVFIAVWALQRRRRALALKRMSGVSGDPELLTLEPPVPDYVSLPPAQVLRVATGLRRQRALGSTSLSIQGTVEATARAGGFISPAFVPRVAAPEYLVLMERRGAEDHAWQILHRWVEQLRDHDVAMDSYDFHSDPRVCTDSGTLRRYSLPELLARYHRSVVIFCGETTTLFDEIAGEPQRWLAMARAMPACVLLTLTPVYRWGQREQALIEAGLVVLPATAEGLQITAAMGNEWWQPPRLPSRYSREYPRVIGKDSVRWLDRNPPPDDVIAKVLQQLAGYLGPQGYLWLCACAVYPQISWPLTLTLLPDIVAPADQVNRKRALDENLPALSRLPWFRHGYMPDWLRRLLIARLPAEKEAAIRAHLGKLVIDLLARNKKLDKSTPRVGLDIAKALTPLDIARAAPDASPLRDQVFIGFLARANPDPLMLRLAAATPAPPLRRRALLEGLLEWWRGFMLRRPAVTRALAAIVVGGIAGVILLTSIPTRVTPLTNVSSDVTHLFGDIAGYDAAIAPDGSFLVMADPTENQPRTLVWDLARGKARIEIPTPAKVHRFAVSPDSTLIAGVGWNGWILVWSAQGRLQRTIGPVNAVVGLSFSADSRLLAVGDSSGVRIFRIADGQVETLVGVPGVAGKPTSSSSRSFVSGVDFGSQSSRLVVSGSTFLETVELEGSGRVSRHVLGAPDISSGKLAQSADGRYLAFDAIPLTRLNAPHPLVVDRLVMADRSIGVYRLSSGTTYVRAMALSPRGEVLAFGGGASDPLQLVNLRSKKLLFDARTVAALPANQLSLWAVRFVSPVGGDRRTRYEITRRSVEKITAPATAASDMRGSLTFQGGKFGQTGPHIHFSVDTTDGLCAREIPKLLPGLEFELLPAVGEADTCLRTLFTTQELKKIAAGFNAALKECQSNGASERCDQLKGYKEVYLSDLAYDAGYLGKLRDVVKSSKWSVTARNPNRGKTRVDPADTLAPQAQAPLSKSKAPVSPSGVTKD